MRPILAAAAFVAAGAATAAWAAAPNDIIWDTPAAPAKGGDDSKQTLSPPVGGAGQPDKNGIIWDTPATPASTTASTPAAKPDANGIIWNAPPVKPGSASSAPPGVLLTSPSGRQAQAAAPNAAAPNTNGPCREFQTSIVIDGKREPAYGTVCQQPDGTWRVVNK